jgi:hypothetical protein
MLKEKKRFFAMFLVTGFSMKVVVEFVHEFFGHGLFILLFGGVITDLHVSVLWPYEFSYVKMQLPDTVTSLQLAWIYAGGIIICLTMSFLTQAFLLLKSKIACYSALVGFWFAFWTLVNSTGYLIIGGLTPFGDVYALIALEVLTSFLSIVIGGIMFSIGFIALSWILRKTLRNVFSPKKASLGVFLFWFIIPLLVAIMLISPDYQSSLQFSMFPLTFIPALASFLMEYFLVLSKDEADENPHDVAEE